MFLCFFFKEQKKVWGEFKVKGEKACLDKTEEEVICEFVRATEE